MWNKTAVTGFAIGLIPLVYLLVGLTVGTWGWQHPHLWAIAASLLWFVLSCIVRLLAPPDPSPWTH